MQIAKVHTENAERTVDWRRLSHIVVLLLVFALAWLNWRYPVVRFAWQPLNYVVFILALLMPAGAVVVAARLRPRWLGWPLATAFTLPALGALILVLFASMLLLDTLKTGDPSFTFVRNLSTLNYDLRIYRTNGGATTAFGAVVRQEITLLPGLRLVRDVYNAYPAEDVRVDVLSQGQFAFDGQKTSLRPLVWF
jgi:hypothetical protein